MKEEALLLGKKASLVGIMTPPPKDKRDFSLPAVILLNAGMLHRAGPYRLYVKMARDLAALGYPVLRFDFSGIGDSPARSDNIPFEEKWIGEIKEVMDNLHNTRSIERFILMGICSGAELSFKAACADTRVVGTVLINPQAHLHDDGDENLNSYIRNHVMVRHNWRIALFSSFTAKKLLKMVRGEVDFRSIAGMIAFQLKSLFTRNGNVSPEVNNAAGDFDSLIKREVHLLHVYSEGDVGLDYLHMMLGDKIHQFSVSGYLNIEIIRGSNHTFTLLANQNQLLKVIRSWVRTIV